MTQATDELLGTDDVSPQKQELLLAFYRVCWEEMTWRRNAGYRTIILGLGYCGILLTVVGFNHRMDWPIRVCLATVIALAALFGSGYLVSNYRKYMAAAARMVKIETYVGAYGSDFLSRLGPLMPAARQGMPNVPITADPVCLWSVIAFLVGGLLTSAAILFV